MIKRVLVIEDQEIYRRLYELTLMPEYDTSIFIDFPSPAEIRQMVDKNHINVVIFSIRVMNPDFLNITKEIRSCRPDLGIILFITLRNQRDAAILKEIAALRGGGAGIIAQTLAGQ